MAIAPPPPTRSAPPQHDERPTALRIGRLLGIPIGIQPLWLVIVGLITWSLGAQYFPDKAPNLSPSAAYALGLLSALLLFAGILLHEFEGHAVVARRNGVRVECIDLWLLGGVAQLRDEPPNAAAELRFAAAGPAVTMVIVGLFGAISAALGDSGRDWLRALVQYQLFINVTILGFNLLPAFPLDGGRILRAFIWQRLADRRMATARAAAVGRMFAWAFVGLGVLGFLSGAPGGLWLALIGGFLYVAGRAEERQSIAELALAGLTAGDVMTSPALTIDADTTLADAVRIDFAMHPHPAYPVLDARGIVVGLLTLRAVRGIPAAHRGDTRVGAVVDHDAGLQVTTGEAVTDIVKRPAFQRTGRAIVTTPDGQPLGIVSTTTVQRLLAIAELRTDDDPAAQTAGTPR